VAAAVRSTVALPARKHLHLDVVGIRIAHSDPHFAAAAFEPKNAQGQQVLDTAVVVLMQSGGRWTVVIGPGTDFPEECTQPTPKPVRELMCPNPFKILGV